MVAFNFKQDFAGKVLSGEKTSTIRKTKRCKVGDKMQLYTGQRTKECKKLADAICVATARFFINEQILWRIENCEGAFCNERALHEKEGFKNIKEMMMFFVNQYGLPFEGYIHEWKITSKNAGSCF